MGDDFKWMWERGQLAELKTACDLFNNDHMSSDDFRSRVIKAVQEMTDKELVELMLAIES
jgi:hypothetical protein